MPSISVKSIRQTLASGQTETALQHLMQLAENAGQETQQSAILLRAAWENQEQQAINGTLSFEEADAQRSRITQGALRLLADIESDGQVSGAVGAGIQKDLYNSQTAAIMQQMYDNDQTTLQGTRIHADDGASVIIGEGNTVHKKTYHALGMRQFGILLLVLVVLGGGGYFVYSKLSTAQDKSFASMSDIQKELSILADLNKNIGTKLEKDKAEIDLLLEKGLAALRDKDYATSILYLEKAAALTPASTIYQNIAFAYEQLGKPDKAQENKSKAMEINPNMTFSRSAAHLKDKRINLLTPENGGTPLVYSTPGAEFFTDGDIHTTRNVNMVVYGFKDGKRAKFDQFATYVPGSEPHSTHEVEILYGNDSPTGQFTSIGIFKPFNGHIVATPFQPYNFPEVTAKYVQFKLRLTGSSRTYELQLWGVLE